MIDFHPLGRYNELNLTILRIIAVAISNRGRARVLERRAASPLARSG